MAKDGSVWFETNERLHVRYHPIASEERTDSMSFHKDAHDTGLFYTYPGCLRYACFPLKQVALIAL
jgi:hypothetical protein